MNFPHPAYFYFLPFKITKPRIQKIIARIEREVTNWNGVVPGNHAMGAREFLFDAKEIGHIHWNGDLDIVFGRQVTEELLRKEHVQRHKYVTDIAITYKIVSDGDILFALSLLRLSYLLKIKSSSNLH